MVSTASFRSTSSNVKALRFAKPKTGPVKQQEQCPQGGGIELNRALPADIDGPEQALQFVTGEDVRPGAERPACRGSSSCAGSGDRVA